MCSALFVSLGSSGGLERHPEPAGAFLSFWKPGRPRAGMHPGVCAAPRMGQVLHRQDLCFGLSLGPGWKQTKATEITGLS